MYVLLMRIGLLLLGIWFFLAGISLDMKKSDEYYVRRNLLINYSGKGAIIFLVIGGLLYAVS